MKCILISTDQQSIYESVIAVTVPAVSGEIQILSGHTEGFFQLRTGDMLLQRGDDEVSIAIDAGFCHVLEDDVTIII